MNLLPADAHIGRTDMGVDVDLKPGEPIVAPGTSRVLGVTQNWYAGQPYVALQLLDGPLKGHNYYVAEQINLAVSPGEIVHPGQPIGHFAASGTGIEMGWAGDNWQQTLAQAQGNTGDPSHNNAPAGISFKHFLDSLSRRAGDAPPAGAADAGASAAPSTPAAPGTPIGPASPASPATPVAPAAQSIPAAPTTPVAPAAAGAPPVPAAGGTPVPAAGAAPVPTPGAPDPNAAGAGISGTAQFRAVGGHEHPHHQGRNTVKFLQAVQPASGSPLASAAGTGAPAGVDPTAVQPGQPVAGQPVVDQIQGQPGTPAVGTPAPAGAPTTGVGAGEQALSQAPVAAGSVVSVSSSMLTSGQQTFVAHLSSLTGLNTRVIAGWVLAEESGSAAQGREASSNFNWLNIGYFDSGTGAIAHATPFSNPVSAAEQTAKFLKGEWGGASTGIRDILKTVGQPPDNQIMAIANSGWASSHYNNGANLRSTFEELANMKVVTAPAAGAGLAVPPAGTAIT